MQRDTDIAGKYRYRTAMVRDLEDGDLFSLDGGQTWHIAWGTQFGTVSVWASHTGTPLVRIPAEEDQEVVILHAFRRDVPEDPAAETVARISPFAVPAHVEAVTMQVEVARPDQECPAWWWEQPQGRHALLLGDPDDGGIAYCGTLPELETFVARAQVALREAQSRQQAGPNATNTPPPLLPDAVVTSRVVTIYDLTTRQRAELADVLGVDRSVRRLPRARDASGVIVAGVKLDSQYGYDIDAAVAYARRAGLRYVEVRETTFESW